MSGMFGDARVHPKHKSVEWYTPAWIFAALGLTFDMDPCSPHDMESMVPAAIKYTVFDDGLKRHWAGRVWLNPPYGPDTGVWVKRMAEHRCGIALVFSRTDASWFQAAMRSADAVCFLAGRVEFIPGHENKHKKSRCGAGTALFSWGFDCVQGLRKLGDRGVFLEMPKGRA
ncbi:MAG: hypothetical protein A2503_10020 [Burkholderiales bacterium RIFOXYD12_FULL_59_19]|nr:MAG: hypothetical protein A2503_10020 [Burkholderiales bacterium RIFOXYD12_FULL_59_19]